MARFPATARRRPALRPGWTGVLAVLAAVAGAVLLFVGVAGQQHAPTPPPSAAGALLAPPRDVASARQAPSAGLGPSAPMAIAVPAIGVHSDLERLGLNPDGSVAVPRSYGSAGWFTRSVTPGQVGPTVILGHVDSRTGPGVFFRLGSLHPGDLVTATRRDGREVRYRITAVRSYSKDAFPTLDVYANTPLPTIRLITCGGQFDSASGHYESNVVAFGQIAG